MDGKLSRHPRRRGFRSVRQRQVVVSRGARQTLGQRIVAEGARRTVELVHPISLEKPHQDRTGHHGREKNARL